MLTFELHEVREGSKAVYCILLLFSALGQKRERPHGRCGLHASYIVATLKEGIHVALVIDLSE